jgi:hypothetical protein
MECFCRRREVHLVRKAKVRRAVSDDPNRGGPESAAYRSYVEQLTYRWAILCPACYTRLDGFDGAATIGGNFSTVVGPSHGDRAAALNETCHAGQRREVARRGLDLNAGTYGDGPPLRPKRRPQ